MMRPLDIFYLLRPLIPRHCQIVLRRALAVRTRRRTADRWPIFEPAGRPPQGWQGWPGNRRFALVLTHDVESAAGHDRCRDMMEIEERMGFRSLFNFVPERYEVSKELRRDITDRGFEVGVHGLRHDGRLFRSRRLFRQRAVSINRYLREWNAVGFRAPSMVSRLDLIRELNVEYDLSTFDTDPFEPQPRGVSTIFPFWVLQPDGTRAFLELPYTLPQDFAVFVALREDSPQIWKDKLDWIAEKGGMAVLITHPDYARLDPDAPALGTYPMRFYEEFLQYIRDRYEGQFWQALPREVSDHFAAHPERVRSGRPKRVCMLAYSFYDSDNRIVRYAESLSRRGDVVDAIGLRGRKQGRTGEVNGVRVRRVQERALDEKRPLDYLVRLLRFWVRSSCALLKSQLRTDERYDLIHVHSVPDFEVFAPWYAKFSGTKLILDIHDILPEFYASKFGLDHDTLLFKALLTVEKLCARFADHVIIANDIWYERLTARSVPARKCTAFINYVDRAVFYRRQRTRNDDGQVFIYPGGLQWHQGLDLAIRAFQHIAAEFPRAAFHIYGDGSAKEDLARLIRELRLQGRVILKGPIPFRDVPQQIANADIGVVAKRADGFGNEAYSTKIMEFMSQGIPVIVSRTAVDQYYFDDSVVLFFEPENVEDLAQKMRSLLTDEALRNRLVHAALTYVDENSWSTRCGDYYALVDRLCDDVAAAADGRRAPAIPPGKGEDRAF